MTTNNYIEKFNELIENVCSELTQYRILFKNMANDYGIVEDNIKTIDQLPVAMQNIYNKYFNTRELYLIYIYELDLYKRTNM